MTKILSYIGVAVLVVTAVVLGYTIIQQPTNQQSSPQVSTTNSTTTNQPSSVNNAAIAEDRKKISEYLGPSADDAQKREFQEIIDRNAQVSDTLNITRCETNPMVLRVKKGSSIKIVNNDSPTNAILFGPGKQYEVPAYASTTMVVDLDTGISSYRCSGIKDAPIVGVFVITE